MATTRLISLHVNKGKSIAQTISERTDYIENPDKTNNGELITGYKCDPRTADVEFLLAKRRYASVTGRDWGKRDVLAYHIRQAFMPGEITPEDANRIGYELALEFTKGNHQFIVATHIDRHHIHNHIMFNSTTLDCTRKFADFLGSARVVRRISDRLCIENGLSVIENPKPSRGHYGTWLGDRKTVTWQEKLRRTIDVVLEKKPENMAVFIQKMKDAGYEVRDGKYLSFKIVGQTRFTRLRSLKGDYTDEAILERIEGKIIVAPKHESSAHNIQKDSVMFTPAKMSLLIDIENSIKAKNSPGYEQWAKIFNLKQAAETLIFLQENNLTEYIKLEEKTTAATNHFNDVSAQLKAKDTRLDEISDLQRYISNYRRTHDVYVEYRKSGYSKKFLAEHEGDIIIHQAAKKTFDKLGLDKLPSIKELQIEYATLLAEKKKLYSEYHKSKKSMKDLLTVKSNTDRLLRYSPSEETHKNQRTR